MTLLKLRNSLVIFRDILKRERYTEEVLISIIGSMKIDRDISRYIVNRVQQTLSVLNEFYNRLVQSSLWKRVVRMDEARMDEDVNTLLRLARKA